MKTCHKEGTVLGGCVASGYRLALNRLLEFYI
jgi:hypothetical protein